MDKFTKPKDDDETPVPKGKATPPPVSPSKGGPATGIAPETPASEASMEPSLKPDPDAKYPDPVPADVNVKQEGGPGPGPDGVPGQHHTMSPPLKGQGQ